MADLPTPADVESVARPDSSTGIRMLRRSADAPTEEIELLVDDLIEESSTLSTAPMRPKSPIPPLPQAALERAKVRNAADPVTPAPDSDLITRLQHELERVNRLYRDQSAYLAELETVFARRSHELLEADEREAALVRRFHLQTLRIGELERQAREQTTMIQQLQAALPRRASQTSSELLQIRGIGPKYAETLCALGVGTIEALAGLEEIDVTRIEQQLRIRNGRIQRERWVEQAKALLPDRSVEN